MVKTPKAVLDVQDLAVVRTAEAALDALYEQYYVCTPADQLVLKPRIEEAARSVLHARLKLLEPRTISAAGDVAEVNRIKDEIGQASSSQQLIVDISKLLTLLKRF